MYLKYAFLFLVIGTNYFDATSVFAQVDGFQTNQQVFHSLIQKISKKLLMELDNHRFSIALPAIENPYSSSLVEDLVEGNYSFQTKADHQMSIQSYVSFSVYWSGKRNIFRRETLVKCTVSIVDSTEIVFTKTFFESKTDSLYKHQISEAQSSLGFEFSNDVENELAKNSKRRILEPLIVLLGVSSTAYLLFTLRL